MKYEIKVTTSLEETNVLYFSTVSLESYAQMIEYIENEYYFQTVRTINFDNSITILVEEGDYSE